MNASPMESMESSEPLVKGSGDATITSFDELESAGVSSQTTHEKQELPNAIEKDEAPKKEVKEKDEESEEKVEKPSKEEKPDPKTEKSEVEKALEKKAKLLKYKNGEETAELSSEVMFEIPVRGKKEMVSLAELTAEYSGKTDWSRKYNELNKEKQAFDQDRAVVQGYVNELHTKLVEEKDAVGALWLLAEAMGGNPVNVISEFQSQLLKKVDDWKDLTPEQRKIQELEERENLRKRQEESALKTKSAQKEQSELLTRVEQVMQEKQIERERFVELYSELKAKVKPDELTPELVGRYHDNLKAWDSISEILDGINPDLGEKKSKAVEQLFNVMDTNKLSMKDVQDIAIEVYGNKQSKNLAKKLKKSEPTDTAKPKKNPDNPIDWEEID